MKRQAQFWSVMMLVVSLLLFSCAGPSTTLTPTASPGSTTTSPSTTSPAATRQSPTATPTATATAAPQYGGVLKIIVQSGISKFGDPVQAYSPTHTQLSRAVFESLVTLDVADNIHPSLAESVSVAPDGKSIIFRLRRGIKFHDGTDFDAEAVKYNLQAHAANTPTAFRVSAISSYDILDDYTIRLNLKAFDANLLSDLALSVGIIGSPTAMKRVTTPERLAQDHMVGTGPFKFVSWQQNANIKFERFDAYWQQGKPYLDGIELIQITDRTTASLSLKRGEAQVLFTVEGTEAKDLAAQGYEISLGERAAYPMLTPDGANQDSPFADKRVREAVDYAIDKKAIADNVGKGYYVATHQPALPGDARFVQGVASRDYDPKKAKELLASAGFPNGFKTRIIVQTPVNDAVVAIATYLKEVGIDAAVEPVDPGRMTALSRDGWTGLQWASPSVNFDLASINRHFSANSVFRKSGYRPPGFYDKLAAAIAEPVEAARLEKTKEVTKVIVDEAMVNIIYRSPGLSALDKKVHGLDLFKGHALQWSPTNAWMSK